MYLQFSKQYERSDEVYQQLLADRAQIDGILGADVAWSNPAETFPVHYRMKMGDLDDPKERARVQGVLALKSNAFVNAFRDRMARSSEA